MKTTDKGTTFSSQEEKEIVFKLIKNHIDLMPKVYRKRYMNCVIVRHLTNHGKGYSVLICKALNVNAFGFEWKEIKND